MIKGGGILNACELTAYITAIANALACNLSDNELELLSAVLLQLGETLDTIVTQKRICNNSSAS